jgi:hypothetical protein
MSLENEHVNYFERRGLNRATCDSMNMRSIEPRELCDLVGRGGLCSYDGGVQIPALDINGNIIDDYSIFAINNNTAKPFFRIGESPHPCIPRDVPKFIKEDNLLIIIVNEIDAAIAVQHKLPCIAIQGSYKWNNSKNIAPLNGMDGVKSDKEIKQDSKITPFTLLLPELQKLIDEFKPRDIVVIGDSNLKANGKLDLTASEQHENNKMQDRRGLEVFVEAIKIQAPYDVNAILTFCPELKGSNSTTTLDDWVIKSGPNEVLRLLDKKLDDAENNQSHFTEWSDPKAIGPEVTLALMIERGELEDKTTINELIKQHLLGDSKFPVYSRVLAKLEKNHWVHLEGQTIRINPDFLK